MIWIEIHIDGGDNKTINLSFYKWIEPNGDSTKTVFFESDHATSLTCDVPFALVKKQLETMINDKRIMPASPIYFVQDHDDDVEKFVNLELMKNFEVRSDYIRFVGGDGANFDIYGDYDEFKLLIKQFTAGLDQNSNPLQPVEV